MTNEGLRLKDLTSEDYNLLMNALKKRNQPLLPLNVAVGDVFKIANMEFIRFPATEHGVPIVAKDLLFNIPLGHETNNFGESYSLNELVTEILPKIEAAVGSENVLEFETDLTALDGLKDYGSIKSKISLPTLDFYRKNVEMFAKYKTCVRWWLATPWSTPFNDCTAVSMSVNTNGVIDHGSSYYDRGIRPILYLNPSVFVSE